MNAGKSCLILTVFALLASTSLASAADNDFRQVWRDSDGQVVRTSTGTCVRSRWVTDEDPCVGNGHTVIAQEDRTVYFAFNRAEISPESKARLDSLAPQLSAAEDVKGADIVGYADRIGTVSYNESLSKKRADAVRDYLASHGFIKPSKIKTRWVGKSKPTANCSNDLPREQLIECLQPDRKATVEIDYDGQPGAETDSTGDE